MQRRYHTLVVLFLTLLTIVGLASASMSPLAAPARAQVVTPDPSPPSFDNQRFVIGSDNLSNPAEGNPPTFATAQLADTDAFPTTTVQVHNYEGFANEQRFWVSVRMTQQDPGVEVVAEPGYAQMGLIAPGGDATYTVTYPDAASARVEFEVDGSTDEAAMLTILQFALEAGFTAADLTGLGSYNQQLGLELANVVAEQFLVDLPSFTSCSNAVAALRRALTDQEQYTRDVQGCLDSPLWQTTVDGVLTRVAERDWFQQSLILTGKAVPAVGATLKTVKATQFAAQVWTMYEKFHPEVPGAMVGTVAFLSVDTTSKDVLGAATAVSDISVYEVVGRAQAAVQQAGTYRYERSLIEEMGRTLIDIGEGDIQKGIKNQAPDGLEVTYYDQLTLTVFQRLQDGIWDVYSPPRGYYVALLNFTNTPATDWTLTGTELVGGTPAYVIERTFTYEIERQEKLWIDVATFLPLKQTMRSLGEGSQAETEIVFSDFGAPVDVQVPPEALAPARTPEPTPLPANPQDLDPQELLTLLLTSPFPISEMPPGYSEALVTEASDAELAYGALSRVKVVTDQEDIFGDEINFTIFASADEAQQGFEAYLAEAQRQGAVVSVPSVAFAYPASQFSVVMTPPVGGELAFGVVVVLVGNVLVEGDSATPPENPEQANVNAVDLAEAGVAHLGQLLGNVTATDTESPDEMSAGNPQEMPTELGTLGTGARVFEISEDGQVVGASWMSADADSVRPILWRDGQLIDLGSLGGAVSMAQDINDSGQIVGFAQDSSGEFQPVLWENGETRNLGADLDWAYGFGTARINESGQILVGNEVWENGEVTNLGIFKGIDINNAGQIVGEGGAPGHAALWANDQITDLGTLGGDWSGAVAINDVGQIIGVSETTEGDQHAFLWQNGEMIDLGDFGGDKAWPTDINNAGQVIGWSQTGEGILSLQSGIWEDDQFSVLNVPVGMDSQAISINDSGQVIGVKFPAQSQGLQHNAQPVVWERSPGASIASEAGSTTGELLADKVEIVSHDIYFELEDVAIAANTAVTFVLPNEGITAHNFSIDALGVSVDLFPGATEELVINAPPGLYKYYCNVPGHKDMGMVGTLTVE
jgi:probable HAF family extracellular repeat protein